MADAAGVMTEVISEFNSNPGGADSGSSSSLPESGAVAPVAAPALNPPEASPNAGPQAGDANEGAGADSDANWYEALLAEQDNDPLRALALDDQAWSGLSTNPQKLAEYASNARSYLQQRAQAESDLASQDADLEWFGGRANAGLASRLAGDLFRGGAPITEEEARQFGANAPQTYAELALERVRGAHEGTAYDLGVAVLNRMPELIKANEDYLLHVLGFNPALKEDYRRVMTSGGYNPTPNQEETSDWFRNNQIPPEYLSTFQRLPFKKQQDMLAGDVEAARFDLEQYHKYFAAEDRMAQEAQYAAQQREFQVEQQATQSLADNSRKIFNDYIEKGKGLGLNPLEAAGAAAMAYAEIEQSYWDERSDARRIMDDWHAKIKTGNKFQIDQGASAYKRAFEQAYRKALGQYQPKRPQAPALQNGQRAATPPNGAQPPQFQPNTPPNEYSNLSGGDLMNEILRSYGAVR